MKSGFANGLVVGMPTSLVLWGLITVAAMRVF